MSSVIVPLPLLSSVTSAGDGEAETEDDGERDADGDREADGELTGDGEDDADGEREADGLKLLEADELGDSEEDGDIDCEEEGESDADGDNEADGEREALELAELDDDGDSDGDADGELDEDGEIMPWSPSFATISTAVQELPATDHVSVLPGLPPSSSRYPIPLLRVSYVEIASNVPFTFRGATVCPFTTNPTPISLELPVASAPTIASVLPDGGLLPAPVYVGPDEPFTDTAIAQHILALENVTTMSCVPTAGAER